MVSSAAEKLLKDLGLEFPNFEEPSLESNLTLSQRLNLLRREEQRPTLFDYQKELVEGTLKIMQQADRGLVSLPTGGGKTRTAVYALLQYFSENPSARAIWLAPTIELLDQAHDTFQALWSNFGSAPNLNISRSLGNPIPGELLLTTPQALLKVKNAASYGIWNTLIFDEAHQLGAPMFLEAVESFLSASPAMSLVGLSATPGRTKTGEIDQLVETFASRLITSKTLGRQPVEFLQKRGILAKLAFKNLATSYQLEISPVERTNLAIKKAAELGAAGRQVLIFAKSVAESEAISVYLRHLGIPAHHVDGSVPDDVRRRRINDFAAKNVRILVNQKVLTTGYDCPAVSDLIIIPKVNSSILFEQMVGRAARGPRTGGTGNSSIWQFDDHLEIHGLPQSYYRYESYEWNQNT